MWLIQVSVQSMESELQQVRDSSSHQKKRVIDMMTNLMKDLADIGPSMGSEFKVGCFRSELLLPRHSADLKMKTVVMFRCETRLSSDRCS